MNTDLKITIPGLTKSDADASTNPSKYDREQDIIIDNQEDSSFNAICDHEAEPLDLLKSALTLIIAKAEAIDIHVDKPKLIGKLKGALEILNQN